MRNTTEFAIKLMEKSLNHEVTGREMRFVGGDVTPVVEQATRRMTIDKNIIKLIVAMTLSAGSLILSIIALIIKLAN